MKRIISLFLAVIMTAVVMSAVMIPSSAESLYIRKIVSIVCDDSGSMEGNKWAYANYALQAFCGMLNSEDQLFITYMNKSGGAKQADLSAAGIQATVDGIENTPCSTKSTPYSAVETAFNKLKSVNDTNPNTQYWLVVITDGAFDEMYYMNTQTEQKKFLNDNFAKYTSTVMPNGTKPQINYLGIGGVVFPDANNEKGIYTYPAATANQIIGAMNDMADKISGRTRLDVDDITKVDGKTIRVSSSIPLLNIVVFTQGGKVELIGATQANAKDIPITRKASLGFSGYKDLSGGAYLLGDSKSVIPSGSYEIKFDQKVDLDDVVILFEPALEMRMSVMLNGKEISDYSELSAASEGDKISISCKIYEMGTDNVIDPGRLPDGTKYEISIFENGKQTKLSAGEEMLLEDYELKNIATKIQSSLYINGFNPITYSTEFTPQKYVPKIVYTISAEIDGSDASIKYREISSGADLSVVFTVYADGKAIKDPETVKALNPTVTTDVAGNEGEVTVDSKGKVIFTPNSASIPTSASTSYDVNVTCTISDGTSASEKYTVTLPVYSIVADQTAHSIKYDDIASNRDLSIYFTVYCDGEPMSDVEEIKALNPTVVTEPSGNGGSIDYDANGRIVFTPNSSVIPAQHNGSFDVKVICTLAGGESAEATYTVLVSVYEIFPTNAAGSVKKTEWIGNTTSVSFYITKDGVKLDKSAVEAGINVYLDEKHKGLLTDVTVAPDGTITVTPYSDDDYVLNFVTCWGNWFRYFFMLSGKDVTVTLDHSYGKAQATIDVVGADLIYQIICVYLPLVIEVAFAAFAFWWIYCIFAKPKFCNGASIYHGTVMLCESNGMRYHEISNIFEVDLSVFNRIKYRWKPTLKSEQINIVGNLTVSAGYGDSVICHCPVWYKGEIKPRLERNFEDLDHPARVARYIATTGDFLRIEPIKPYENTDVQAVSTLDAPSADTYCICLNNYGSATAAVDEIDVGTIFAYAYHINP